MNVEKLQKTFYIQIYDATSHDLGNDNGIDDNELRPKTADRSAIEWFASLYC
jgi:hypothetical protein